MQFNIFFKSIFFAFAIEKNTFLNNLRGATIHTVSIHLRPVVFHPVCPQTHWNTLKLPSPVPHPRTIKPLGLAPWLQYFSEIP